MKVAVVEVTSTEKATSKLYSIGALTALPSRHDKFAQRQSSLIRYFISHKEWLGPIFTLRDLEPLWNMGDYSSVL